MFHFHGRMAVTRRTTNMQRKTLNRTDLSLQSHGDHHAASASGQGSWPRPTLQEIFFAFNVLSIFALVRPRKQAATWGRNGS
jgi:hypothetical protein